MSTNPPWLSCISHFLFLNDRSAGWRNLNWSPSTFSSQDLWQTPIRHYRIKFVRDVTPTRGPWKQESQHTRPRHCAPSTCTSSPHKLTDKCSQPLPISSQHLLSLNFIQIHRCSLLSFERIPTFAHITRRDFQVTSTYSLYPIRLFRNLMFPL